MSELSETTLCNDALGQIGQPSISGIDDGSTLANRCNTFYPALRKAFLRAHRWNFAETRVELALNAEAPATEFAYGYTLPADCLMVREYSGGSPSAVIAVDLLLPVTSLFRYKIEGRNLLSNDGQAFIVYTADITNAALWDPLFYQMLAKFLASKLATAVLKDFKLSMALKREAYELDFAIAAAVDGQEGSVEPQYTHELLWGRSHA